jgi:dipeptidyl aminopeptidase/acylaminoacyl peptidase
MNRPCPPDILRGRAGRVWVLGLVLVALIAGLGACGDTRPMRVTLLADGEQVLLDVTGQSVPVRTLLDAAGVTLGSLDRVEPDLYVTATDGLTVTVTRVEETFENERQPVPFAHRTVRSEGVPAGEQRLLQVGANGQIEITYKLVLEDGAEVSRQEVRREIVVEPVDEIVLVGVEGQLTSVPISGTIAYLTGGNAWFMRESSELRRNITGYGDLDGRVFALSGDGARLLFTRAAPGDGGGPLNSLWLARTSLVGEEPQDLGITGAIWAEWSPDGTRIAYSTAERTEGVPGWKANNDLWLMAVPDDASEVVSEEAGPRMLLAPSAEIPYAWWGRTYSWSPDGQVLAYGQADQVGTVTLDDGVAVSLMTFPPLRTQSSWAWVPEISWAPDGSLLAFVVHEGDLEGLSPEDSPIFGLWAVSPDGNLRVRLAEEVGMWAAPRWSPVEEGLLSYGQAQSPRNSQDSRYELFVMDRDGSNARRLFPPEGLMGLVGPDVAWSPDGERVLIEYEGNLYRVNVEQGLLDQLTSDGQSSHPRWAR